jgi:roadblock/LC7 domain-containing protein
MGNEFIARKGLIALEDSRVTGSLTVSGSLKITGSVALNNIPNSSTANALYYNTTDGTVSYAAAGAGGNPFPFTGTAVISGSLQIVTSGSRAMVISASQASNYISQSLSQSAVVGATIYGLSIAPTFTNTTSSQTQTALRVSPTFTGSFSSSATNNIVDFGTSIIGSQFIINDIISGSIYQVNDSNGLPIIEATSDWMVNLYEGPTNIVFQKSGSAVYITNAYMTGSLQGTSSYAITASYANTVGSISGLTLFPFTGNAIISGSLQIVTSGSRGVIISASQAANYISQSLSQSTTVGATIYGLSISPTFTNTTSSQTQTALKINPTFTGSFSSSATNNVVDFGTSTIGSQFIINDIISGSIYQVNDSNGLPIIEATSDYMVNLYEGPTNIVFQKSGSGIYITSLLSMATGSTFVLPLTASSISPKPTGSAYFSGSFLYIWNGTRYVSSSFS